MKISKICFSFIIHVCSAASPYGCAPAESSQPEDSSKIRAVATIFPQYDFLRQIGGDHLELTMLLKPGSESHSFEPTPADMIAVSRSDLFVYVGGDSDAWVETILESVDTSGKEIVTLMDCVETVAEEEVEGMETHGHAHDHEEEYADEGEGQESAEETDHEHAEQDEHVWTSPRNAVLIVEKLREALIAIDPENAGDYTQNAADYIAKLEQLDQEFQDVTDSAERNTIILGDRFLPSAIWRTPTDWTIMPHSRAVPRNPRPAPKPWHS